MPISITGYTPGRFEHERSFITLGPGFVPSVACVNTQRNLKIFWHKSMIKYTITALNVSVNVKEAGKLCQVPESFICRCYEGYKQDADGKSCLGKLNK